MRRLPAALAAAAALGAAAGLAAALTLAGQRAPVLVRTGPTVRASTAGYRLPRAVPRGQLTLSDVSCSSPAACTVAGYVTAGQRDTPYASRWNGRSWAVQPVPSPPGGGQLLAVACPAATACTAVGQAARGRAGSGRTQPLAEAWDGRRWRAQRPVVPVRDASLSDVSCSSPSACMAVVTFGSPQTLMERWDGRAWTLLGTPAGSMESISCLPGGSCVAAGSDVQQDFGIWSQYWDGSTWAVQAAPGTGRGGAGDETVSAVSCASAPVCMAVGSDFYNSYHLTAERWDGARWSGERQLATPGWAGSAGLGDVSCPTDTFCMAVGSFTDAQDNGHPAAARWDGSGWAVMTTGNFRGQYAGLSNVSCPSARFCLALGGLQSAAASGPGRPLAERWDGSGWAVLPLPGA